MVFYPMMQHNIEIFCDKAYAYDYKSHSQIYVDDYMYISQITVLIYWCFNWHNICIDNMCTMLHVRTCVQCIYD